MKQLTELDRVSSSDSERRRELSRFLRVRREAISPESIGLPPQRRRRTPGLRREEVALLAGIGAAWYSRVEMGDAQASASTLLAIARALRLTSVESEYVFALADIPVPKINDFSDIDVPEAIEWFVPTIERVGAVLWDRYATPIRWNAIADGMFEFSRYADPVDRNVVVRLMRDEVRQRKYFGDDYHNWVRGVVGMFHRAYMTGEPSEYARRVHDIAKDYPIFNDVWDEQVIAEDYFEAGAGPFQRQHDIVGEFSMAATNLFIPRHNGMFLRILAPADDAAAEKFEQLRKLGTPSTRNTKLP